MTGSTFRIEIDRPVADVFAYVTDPTRFAEWQTDVVDVRVAPGWHPDLGAELTTVRRIGRSSRTYSQRITRWEPPRRWEVRGIDGTLRPGMLVEVEPLGSTRCAVAFTLDFEGEGLADLVTPVVRRMAARTAPTSYRRLKALLESQPAPPA